MRKLGKFTLLIVNLIAVAALIIAYCSVYIPPDKWWFPSFFGLGFIYIFLVNVLFIILWLFLKPRYLVFSFVAILAGLGFINRYIQFKDVNIIKGDLKIISYNVKFFTGNYKSSSRTVADSILQFLNKENPDLVCLQEVRLKTNTVFNLDQIRTKYAFAEHYQYARASSTFGSVTLTRFPISNMGEIRFEGSRNIAIYTDIVMKKDTFRVFNVHLQSYHINPKDYSVIESAGITEEEDLQEMQKVGSKFIKAFKMRAKQSRIINEYIRKSPFPVIVCGDFNDPPVSYTYRKMKNSLKDSFVESGKGVARTYIDRLPSIRIDYILHGRKFDSYNYREYDFRLSDHVPISCDLKKKQY